MERLDGALWRKSSYSGANGAQCVEVGTTKNTILVRDTKNPDGPRLTFGREAWEAFASAIKSMLLRTPPDAGSCHRVGGCSFSQPSSGSETGGDAGDRRNRQRLGWEFTGWEGEKIGRGSCRGLTE